MTESCANNKLLEHIDAEIIKWRQGDYVLGENWFVHRCDPNLAITEEGAAAAKDGFDLAETAVKGFEVLTQTCDIVRTCQHRPFIEIAPLVEVQDAVLREIERGRRPQYAHIPGAKDQNLVGDLNRVMTIEKANVVGWERNEGCITDDDTRKFAQALTSKRSRFAFPDDFTSFAAKFLKKLQEKHDNQSVEGKTLRALMEIRVRAAPSWEEKNVELTFIFIRDEKQIDFEGMTWDDYLNKWLDLVPDQEGIGMSVPAKHPAIIPETIAGIRALWPGSRQPVCYSNISGSSLACAATIREFRRVPNIRWYRIVQPLGSGTGSQRGCIYRAAPEGAMT